MQGRGLAHSQSAMGKADDAFSSPLPPAGASTTCLGLPKSGLLLMQREIDLTHTLSESTLVHPSKTPFSRVICAHYECGYRLDDMQLSMGIGTHMDAPKHFFPEGLGMEAVPLSQCYGFACVIHLSAKVQDRDYAVTRADCEEWEKKQGLIPAQSIVLIHTGWDRYWGTAKFCEQDGKGVCHFPGVSAGAAQLLVERQVLAVGIDTMGMDVGSASECKAHQILLGANIVIVENLANLGMLPARGAYVHMLPMKIEDAPEAPIRAMATIHLPQ